MGIQDDAGSAEAIQGMTHDFLEEAVKACESEGIPYVFAMRAGNKRGDWRVSFNLRNHPRYSETLSKEEDVLLLLKTVIEGE